MKKVFVLTLSLLFMLTACQTDVPKEPPVEKQPTVEKEPMTDKKEEEEKKTNYQVNQNNFNIEKVPNRTIKTSEKLALLTIDDAPRNFDVVESLLQTLAQNNVKAIWFINGINLVDTSGKIKHEAKEILLKIKNEGHILANHSYSHQNLLLISNEKELEEEIVKTSILIEEITGEKPKYFRHPFGAYNNNTIKIVGENGMQHMNWSVGSLDWEYSDPEKIHQQVISTMVNGGNILFHDLPQTANAMEGIIKELKNNGYTFVLPTK